MVNGDSVPIGCFSIPDTFKEVGFFSRYAGRQAVERLRKILSPVQTAALLTQINSADYLLEKVSEDDLPFQRDADAPESGILGN